ncbi:hypothetical protein MHB44_10755 [Lysinibacillus sp. FSL H8-0500]|uniref:hypothetical protein n=1 Tax=Lysinibacillus sp. FSL H8-0500 TaxID=2921393 RepID=UPI0031011A44
MIQILSFFKEDYGLSHKNNEGTKSVSQAAKLAVIAGAITTLGDALATIAAGLALEDELKDNDRSTDDIDKLQKQIDELHNEMKQLKRMLR